MYDNINVLTCDMPTSIKGYTVCNLDFSFTVILNDKLSYCEKQKAYEHELGHIKNGDYYKKSDINMIEIRAHNM